MLLFVQQRGQGQGPGDSLPEFKPLKSYVTLGTLFHLSVLQLPPLKNGMII